MPESVEQPDDTKQFLKEQFNTCEKMMEDIQKQVTVGDLRRMLDGLKDEVIVTVKHSHQDRYNAITGMRYCPSTVEVSLENGEKLITARLELRQE